MRGEQHENPNIYALVSLCNTSKYQQIKLHTAINKNVKRARYSTIEICIARKYCAAIFSIRCGLRHLAKLKIWRKNDPRTIYGSAELYGTLIKTYIVHYTDDRIRSNVRSNIRSNSSDHVMITHRVGSSAIIVYLVCSMTSGEIYS